MTPPSPLSDEISAYGMNDASKNCRAASSSFAGTARASSQARARAPGRGQPARKARRLGSSAAAVQPGKVSMDASWDRTVSVTGFGGGHCGHTVLCGNEAQPASTTMSNRRYRMWVVYLEMGVALALAALIVWWTWPKKDK